MVPTPYNRRKVIAWSFYDWANSAFATTVMAGFFPVFFKQYWSVGTDVSVSTFHLGTANSCASIIVALMSPILGAMADKGGAKKMFLFFFAAMGIVMTGALACVAKGAWQNAALLYVLATGGFFGGNVFYDSLLVSVAGEKRVHSVSALGYSLGYLGGGLLFALNVMMTLSPSTFGLADVSEAVRMSFASVAVWWGLFSLPLFFFVPEPRTGNERVGLSWMKSGFRQLGSTLREIRKLKVVMVFLVGYWLYIDGVNTVIEMAVDYGLSLGFASRSLLVALLITQFVGFPAAIVFGRIGQRLGAKTGIFIGIGVYLGATIWGALMHHVFEFYILAVIIGLVQGGVQSLSRSLFAQIIPENKTAEFFGLYNMLGKFAAVLGPFLMGWVSLVSGNPRISIISISVLFLLGGTVLSFVDEKEGRNLAWKLEKL
jgi:MFS transporter, UMF1 family